MQVELTGQSDNDLAVLSAIARYQFIYIIKKRGKMMKKKLALVVLMTFGLMMSACGNDAANNQAEVEDPGVPVYTKVLQAENFNRVIVTGGLLQPESTVYVIPKISGMEEIKNVYVKVGDKVTAGQKLASLDQESTMLQYDATKVQYDEMMKNLNNYKALYDAGAVSRTDYESLEAQAKALDIQMRGLQMQLDYLEITAPISGTITAASAEVGSYASASQAMFTIANADTLEVQAGISEGNVSKLAVGDVVSITIPTLDKAVYEGRIVEIGLVMDQTSKSYPVRISLDNSQGNFLAGMYAEVSIITDRVTDALVVPVDAISYKGDATSVMVVVDDKAEQRIITTGVNDGDSYVVTDGLASGDAVIVKGNTDLVSGEKVTVTKVVNQLDIEPEQDQSQEQNEEN